MKLRSVRSVRVPSVRPSKVQASKPNWDDIYSARAEESLGRYGY